VLDTSTTSPLGHEQLAVAHKDRNFRLGLFTGASISVYYTAQTSRAFLAQTPSAEDVIAASDAHNVAVGHQIFHEEDTIKDF